MKLPNFADVSADAPSQILLAVTFFWIFFQKISRHYTDISEYHWKYFILPRKNKRGVSINY